MSIPDTAQPLAGLRRRLFVPSAPIPLLRPFPGSPCVLPRVLRSTSRPPAPSTTSLTTHQDVRFETVSNSNTGRRPRVPTALDQRNLDRRKIRFRKEMLDWETRESRFLFRTVRYPGRRRGSVLDGWDEARFAPTSLDWLVLLPAHPNHALAFHGCPSSHHHLARRKSPTFASPSAVTSPPHRHPLQQSHPHLQTHPTSVRTLWGSATTPPPSHIGIRAGPFAPI